MKNKILKECLDWALTLIIPVGAALLIHLFLFTFTVVNGPSMMDTLFTGERAAVSRIHYKVVDPERGDIVVCHYPGREELFIKRVIGLGGEKLAIFGGTVYINGQPIEEPYVVRPQDMNMLEVAIPEGYVFVMGDNRANSTDSRSVGPVPTDQLYGYVMGVAWPFNHMQWFHGQNPDYGL